MAALCFTMLALGMGGTRVKAQDPAYINYTSRDALPTNEIYEVTQLADGHMLFSTERGLIEYNGKAFSLFPAHGKAINNHSVFKVRHRGESIIAVQYFNTLFEINDDSAYVPDYYEELQSLIENHAINDIEVDGEGNIFLSTNTFNLKRYRISADGIVSGIACDGSHRTGAAFHLYRLPGTDRWISRRCASRSASGSTYQNVKPASPEDERQDEAMIKTASGYTVFPSLLPFPRDVVHSQNMRVLEHNGRLWFGHGRNLICKDLDDQSESIFSLDGALHSIDSMRDGTLLIGTDVGLYVMRPRSTELVLLLEGFVVTDCFHDVDDGLWLTSLNRGIVYVPAFHLRKMMHPLPPAIAIRSLAANDQRLALHSFDHGLFILEKTNGKWQALNYPNDHPALQRWSSTMMFKGHDTLFFGCNALSIKSGRYLSSCSTMVSDVSMQRGEVFWVQKKNRRISNHSGAIALSWADQGLTTSLFVERDSSLLVGTSEGLYKHQLSTGLTTPYPSFEPIADEVLKLLRWGKDNIVAISPHCVYVITPDGRIALDKTSGLIDSRYRVGVVESDSVIWIGSDGGIHRVSLRDGQCSIRYLGPPMGLSSAAIRGLVFRNDTIFIANDQGLYFFDTRELDLNMSLPWPRLLDIQINDSLHALVDSVTLEPDQRNIHFRFSALTFRPGMDIEYAYRMRGHHLDWIVTHEEGAPYYNLPPGDYVFETRVRNNKGPWSPVAISVPVSVTHMLTEHTSFWIVLIVGILLLTTGLMFWYFRQRDRQRKVQWSYSQAQLQALSLQMNPHFIYNALNTVQYLANTGKNYLLEHFLGSLSKLTRSILDNSRQLLIPLDKELENLAHYLSLEQQRFGEKTFQYQIHVAPAMDASRLFIPPLLLQPLVENALWHGLYPKEGNTGCVEVRCEKRTHGFMVCIRDNGIGRRRSAKNQQDRATPSIGIENTRSRMELYKKMGFGTARLSIVDLETSDREPCGTEVVLEFSPEASNTFFRS